MRVEELNKYYDKLQLEYGEPTLCSIYNGGCQKNPDVCFVFMNPTGRNVASTKEWKGIRAPWIGTKNIWKLYYNIGIIEKDLFDDILAKKPSDWTEEFAKYVYDTLSKNKVYVTNLGKCTQIDARPLPDRVLKQYLELLYNEIDIVRPKKIIVCGNQVGSIVLNQKICVKSVRKQEFKVNIKDNEYSVYPVFYPIGNGMRNIDLAIEDLKYILKN